MIVHYTDPYLLNPVHKVTVDLVGMGGTGSQVITSLARINEALTSMGHPGLHVRSWDSDMVSSANIGRQLFSSSDIGINKAIVLTTRINRFFGYEWEAVPESFGGKASSNITITCVDSAMARIMIGMHIEGEKKAKKNPSDRRIYWLDMGNLAKTGQVVLGTLFPVPQPKSDYKTRPALATVTKKFPQLKKLIDKEKDLGPSCSLAEALNKQDLFINSTLAQLGSNLIWKLFREGMIKHHGCYLNLETMNANPMPIK